MSTHNIGFYEDFTKIIFELSSNIIKYAPYFFCCSHLNIQIIRTKLCHQHGVPTKLHMGIITRKHSAVWDCHKHLCMMLMMS